MVGKPTIGDMRIKGAEDIPFDFKFAVIHKAQVSTARKPMGVGPYDGQLSEMVRPR